MKHIGNILLFLICWGLGYHFGHEATYINGLDFKDLLATFFFIFGLAWLYYKYAR